jgi:hypothetical protein
VAGLYQGCLAWGMQAGLLPTPLSLVLGKHLKVLFCSAGQVVLLAEKYGRWGAWGRVVWVVTHPVQCDCWQAYDRRKRNFEHMTVLTPPAGHVSFCWHDGIEAGLHLLAGLYQGWIVVVRSQRLKLPCLSTKRSG